MEIEKLIEKYVIKRKAVSELIQMSEPEEDLGRYASVRRILNEIIDDLSSIEKSITNGLACKCGNKTFTHRHSNWIECTACNKIKIL